MLVSTAGAYPSVLHFRARLVAMTRNIRVEMVPVTISLACNTVAVMEQHIFCIFIDYRRHHRKGAAI
jgi:hypothetical protein